MDVVWVVIAFIKLMEHLAEENFQVVLGYYARFLMVQEFIRVHQVMVPVKTHPLMDDQEAHVNHCFEEGVLP